MAFFSLSDIKQNSPVQAVSGQEDRYICPSCGSTKPKNKEHCSFSVNRNTGGFKCHRCGISGCLKEYWKDKKSTQRKTNNLQPRVTIQSLKEKVIPSQEDTEKIESAKEEYKRIQALDSDCYTYLECRGINRAVIETLDLSLLVNKGYKNIVFPVLNTAGELVGISKRGVTGSFKGNLGPTRLGFYATPGALESEYVSITEAPIDAISLYSLGVPAIALCGSAMHETLKQFLTKSINGKSRKIYIALDNDQAGQDATEKIIDSFYISTVSGLSPEGFKDWNEWLCEDYFGLFDYLLEQIPELKKQYHNQERASHKAELRDEPVITDSEQIRKAVLSSGYCLIHCEQLGEKVYFLKDSSITPPNDSFATYTMDELEGIARNSGDITRDSFKQIHDIKEMFDGVIVPDIYRPV